MFKKFLIPLMLLMPGFAFAANLFDPVSADKSMLILAAIFGKLEIFGNSGNDPFAAGIQAFNGAVLMIGGIIVAYTIVAGTVGTAHEGEMLGKKFSSVWVPIRTALGTALVLPVINGTYCVMQGIVGWLIVQGIGLADNVWNVYTSKDNLGALASAGIQNIGAKSFGYNVFQSQVCVAAINKVIEQTKAEGNSIVLSPNAKAEMRTSFSTTGVSSEDKLNFGIFGVLGEDSVDSCGSATIPRGGIMDYTRTNSGGASTILSLGMNGALEAKERAKAISDVQYKAANDMVKDMKDLAEKFVNGAAISNTEINAAISKYEKSVQDEATKQITSLKEFETMGENASKDGWIMAGAFYTKFSFMADLIQRSMSDLGTATGPKSFNNPLFNDSLALYSQNLTELLGHDSKAPISAGFGVSAENGTDKGWGRIIKDQDFDAAMKKIFTIPNFFVQDGEHPLMAMKRLGNTLLSGVTITLAAALAGIFVTGLASTAVGFFIGVTTLGLLMPLLVSGILLSYLLPMLPFFLWFGATIGWVIMCIEALLAAPMWAIMHLSPHGDDMVGTGSQGYKLVLSLMLRPVLMIFGLVASFVGLSVIGGFFNQIFFDVFVLNQQDSSFITWIAGLIIAPIMYAIGMFVLIKKLFSMIYIIPDEMLKWFGGGGPQLGNFANTIGGEQGGMAMAAGVIGNSTANLANAGGKRVSELQGGAAKTGEMMKGSGANENSLAGVKKLSGLSQAKFGHKLDGAMKSVGGAGSEGANQLMDKYNELGASNPDATPDELLKQAQEHYHKSNYGPDAQELIHTMTGEDYSGVGYNRLMGSLNAKQGKLVRGGMSESEAKETVKGMISKTMEQFSELPPEQQTRKNLGEMLQQTSSLTQAPSFQRPDVAGGKNVREESQVNQAVPPEPTEGPGAMPSESGIKSDIQKDDIGSDKDL